MNRLVLFFGLSALLLGLSFAAPATPARALYCGQRLVHRADTTERVREICGDPDDRARRVETRSQSVARRVQGVIVVQTFTVEVTIEEWTYDLGPNQLVRYLVFEDGRLIDERTGSYGSAGGNSRSKPNKQ